MGLVLGRVLVHHRPGPILVYGNRFAALVGPQFGNPFPHRFLVVVVLERRLHGEGVGAGILLQGPVNVHRRQVPPERHRPRPDYRIQRDAQPFFQVVQARQPHLQHQLGGNNPVVQGRIAPGQEYPLGRQVPSVQVFLHDAVAVEQVLHVLDEWDHPQLLGKELSHPVPHHPPLEQGQLLLPDDHPPVVGLHQGQFLRRGREGQDDFLDRRSPVVPVPIEVAGHVPRRGNALQCLHHRLPHIPLDPGIGHPQRQDHIPPQPPLVLEELRVSGQQLADYLVIRLLPLRVPHLLVAAQGKHRRRLLNLPLSPDYPRLVGERRRGRVVGVLGTHHLRNKKHCTPPRTSAWALNSISGRNHTKLSQKLASIRLTSSRLPQCPGCVCSRPAPQGRLQPLTIASFQPHAVAVTMVGCR